MAELPANVLVFGQRQAAQVSFDLDYQKEISEIVGDIGILHGMLIIAGIKAHPSDIEAWVHSLALLKSARDTLVSSFHLVRQRASRDAFALLRVALETAAVAVHVSREPSVFEQYAGRTAQKFQATRSVSWVKHLLPRMPEVWGALSQAAVHVNRVGFGPLVEQVADVIDLTGDPVETIGGLHCTSLATAVVIHAAELVLLSEQGKTPGLIALPGGALEAMPLGAQLVERRHERFISLKFREAAHLRLRRCENTGMPAGASRSK